MANEIARKLRKQMTRQEVRVWQHLRQMRASGFHFRRQAPVGCYIVDFVCFDRRIIIEIDGGQHGVSPYAKADAARDSDLRSQGYRIVRFWNSDIDQNLRGVIETILDLLGSPPPDRPSGGHPPHRAQ